MICHSCGQTFSDFGELARHIISQKKGHRQGKRWATNYLMKTRQLNRKGDLPTRAPLTDEERENKRDMVRELSGQQQTVRTMCPHCKSAGTAVLPIEYAQSPTAWAVSGHFMILCDSCK